jgi:hypothetical protein
MPKSSGVIDMIGNPGKASIAVTAAILGLAACATPPPAEVETVAQSGIKFADSVSPLLNNALDGAIASNSDTLIMARLDRGQKDGVARSQQRLSGARK